MSDFFTLALFLCDLVITKLLISMTKFFVVRFLLI